MSLQKLKECIKNKSTFAVDYIKERKKFCNNLNLKLFTDNKVFWKTVKPFLSDKGKLTRKINISEGDTIVSEDNKVAEILNTYFSESIKSLNIKENSFILNSTNHLSDRIETALHKFNIQHPSILKIREKVGDGPGTFKFKNMTVGEVIRKINRLNRKKATTSNSIPITNLKEHEDISGSILHKIINQEISNFHFPDELKLAERFPLHKENDVMNKRNFRP